MIAYFLFLLTRGKDVTELNAANQLIDGKMSDVSIFFRKNIYIYIIFLIKLISLITLNIIKSQN